MVEGERRSEENEQLFVLCGAVGWLQSIILLNPCWSAAPSPYGACGLPTRV